MAPDGVDFAVSAGKYHSTRQRPLGMALLSSWVPLGSGGSGGSGLSVLSLQLAVGQGLHGKEGRCGYLISQHKAPLVQQL